MAEFMLKIGNTSAYDDGDILHYFNNRRIWSTHAQHICHVKNFGFNGDGRRPLSTLAQFMHEKCFQYKFERVSFSEVVRTDLSSMDQETFSLTPNVKGEYIDVPLYLARRLDNPNHKIFGSIGSEIWYGGRENFDLSKVNDLWAEIEDKTPNRKVDHDLWPTGSQDLKDHFLFSVDDGTDAEVHEMESPVINGIEKKRKYKVVWESFAELSGQDIASIKNKNQSVEKRKEFIKNPNSIKVLKT